MVEVRRLCTAARDAIHNGRSLLPKIHQLEERMCAYNCRIFSISNLTVYRPVFALVTPLGRFQISGLNFLIL